MLADGLKFFITGAASGIGAGCARVAVEQGAAVTIVDVADEAGEKLAEELRSQGGNALYLHCDVTDYDQLKSAIDTSATQFDGLDALVNNVGVFDTVVHPAPSLDTMDETHFRRLLEINLVSHWMAAKYALPYLRQSANASITNAGSVAAWVAYPGGPMYAATKGGVVQLTKQLAMELAPSRIRVNCYCPGSIRTEAAMRYVDQIGEDAFIKTNAGCNLVPRIGEPEDIGNLVTFLASPRASFITGAVYLCDGGSLAWRGTLDVLGMEPERL